MEDDSKSTDKSDASLSFPTVRITIVDPPSEEESATWSSLNDEITNEVVRSELANVEIPKEEFDKGIQDIGCSKEELKVKCYRAEMIPAYRPK